MKLQTKGHTLLEVLIVVAVLGILAGFALPRLGDEIAGQRLISIGEELAADIRYLQQRAMAEGVYHEIRFYQYTNPPRYVLLKETTEIKRKNLPLDVMMTIVSFPRLGLTPALRFTYTGRPTAGGTVELTNEGEKKVWVITTPVTARVKVEKQ